MHKNRGFTLTLIEVMIVLASIAILAAILAAIALPACESLVKHQTQQSTIINKD